MARLPNLFVALVPPPGAVAPLVAAVGRLQDRVPEPAWVAPERWHVTLCFLGPVEPLPQLGDRLADVAGAAGPMDLRIDRAGRFGDRVLWAGLRGDLRPLSEAVSEAARGTGLTVDDRPFRAHLTLARGRRRIDLRPLVDELQADLERTPPTVWTADEIVLMRGGQPAYERLASWRLS